MGDDDDGTNGSDGASSIKITEKLKSLPPESRYFSLEFFPPKTQAGFSNLLPRLTRLTQLSPLFVTVTWGAGGSTAAKSLDLAEITQRQLGLTTCLHLTCTNMRRRVLDGALERCKEIGVRNVLALRGDEPRPGEYADEEEEKEEEDNNEERGSKDDEAETFEYAVDLVRYIRRKHGDYFCIGVAAYPEGHATSAHAKVQDPRRDLPYLVDKTRAGADFIMTQLFYDVGAFLRYERMLRTHESGAFADVQIIPGLMPIQSWSTMRRITNLSCAKVPDELLGRLEAVKNDDEAVKDVGIAILSEIVSNIDRAYQTRSLGRPARHGFHFYTLNLEKAVAQVLERCRLMSGTAPPRKAVAETKNGATVNGHTNGTSAAPTPDRDSETTTADPPRRDSKGGAVVKDKALAASEEKGSLGREATWDDFPNGRWGDTRSPAYGSIDGYGPTLHVSRAEALALWGSPTSAADVTKVFSDYLNGKIAANPWSEESLSAETELVREYLVRLTERCWWTVASQPAVDAAPSGDEMFGWGPKVGGWVWQKPFVEFFISSEQWAALKQKLDGRPGEVTYFAGNARGRFESNDEDSVNTVTWGAFKDKEIISPTIIDSVSFRTWQDEAFGIWHEWQRVYPVGSESSKLLQNIRNDFWLVNVVGHDYMRADSLWELLLE